MKRGLRYYTFIILSALVWCNASSADSHTGSKYLTIEEAEKRSGKAPRTEENKLHEKIYTNCIADKLPPKANREFTESIISICSRAMENPTFWNRLRYDYLGQ